MAAEPLVIVVSGPSASGKGTLLGRLRQRFPEMVYSVSATTRSPRPGERDGVEYFFISHDEFEKRLNADDFLEWAEVYGNYYGTPRSLVDKALKEGKDVLLELDVQGARQVKKALPQAILIFIKPPSLEELDARITKRGMDTEEAIKRRLQAAWSELQAAADYDYTVVNDDQERAVAELEDLIIREKKRRSAG